MKKCVKIHLEGSNLDAAFRLFVQKKATALQIEGTVRNDNEQLAIIHAQGESDNLDKLIDQLYKGTAESSIDNVSVEPFVSDSDFRGVFRIIGD